jgi:hypothetical protein
MRYHGATVRRIAQQAGADSGRTLLSQSLYVIVVGSNDFLGNYMRNASRAPAKPPPAQFVELLIASYAGQIEVSNPAALARVL